MILNYTKFHNLHRVKRSVHAFTHDCNEKAEFWNPAKVFSASFFAPGVASAKALATLNKLGCWLAKQTNATSGALSSLLLDVDSVRQATLQNRAATDFLLLAHGHGCEDFDGLCCMNLSDHSESVHKSIQTLKELPGKLQVEDDWNTFAGLFSRLEAWVKKLIVLGALILLVFISLLICIPC